MLYFPHQPCTLDDHPLAYEVDRIRCRAIHLCQQFLNTKIYSPFLDCAEITTTRRAFCSIPRNKEGKKNF